MSSTKSIEIKKWPVPQLSRALRSLLNNKTDQRCGAVMFPSHNFPPRLFFFSSFMPCTPSRPALTRSWPCRSTSTFASWSSLTWGATKTGGWQSATGRRDTSPPTTLAKCPTREDAVCDLQLQLGFKADAVNCVDVWTLGDEGTRGLTFESVCWGVQRVVRWERNAEHYLEHFFFYYFSVVEFILNMKWFINEVSSDIRG